MGKVTIYGGDFAEQVIYFISHVLVIAGGMGNEKIPSKQLKSVEVATENTVKKLSGSIGLGLAGGLLLGPVGMIAGALAGGNKKEITFVATFHDGRTFVATTDPKTFANIKAEAHDNSYEPPVLKRDIQPVQHVNICDKCGKEKESKPFAARDECDHCGEKLRAFY